MARQSRISIEQRLKDGYVIPGHAGCVTMSSRGATVDVAISQIPLFPPFVKGDERGIYSQ